MDKQRISKLPKWAQAYFDRLFIYIGDLIREKRTLQNMIRCHDSDMEWYCINNFHDEELKLFKLNSEGAFLQCTLYKGDRLFVGRVKRQSSYTALDGLDV